MSASGIGIIIVAQRWEDIDGSIALYTQSYKDLVQSKSLDNRCEVLKIRLVTVLKYRLSKKWIMSESTVNLDHPWPYLSPIFKLKNIEGNTVTLVCLQDEVGYFYF